MTLSWGGGVVSQLGGGVNIPPQGGGCKNITGPVNPLTPGTAAGGLRLEEGLGRRRASSGSRARLS